MKNVGKLCTVLLGLMMVFSGCAQSETDDTEKTTACVYKNGNYIRNSLTVASGYTLTDADVEKLRTVNIIVETAQE